MMFNEFFEVLKNNNFDEIPVDAKTFVESPDYLGQPPLSDIQYDIVEAMSQIYKLEDLIEIMGDTEGRRYYKKYTKNEVILFNFLRARSNCASLEISSIASIVLRVSIKSKPKPTIFATLALIAE